MPPEKEVEIPSPADVTQTEPSQELEKQIPADPIVRKHRLLVLDRALPQGENLQTLSKLLRALRVADGEFCFISWDEKEEIGRYLDKIALHEPDYVICFAPDLSELICDNEITKIIAHWQDTAYSYKFLPCFSLNQLSKMPKAKIHLWNSLKQIVSK